MQVEIETENLDFVNDIFQFSFEMGESTLNCKVCKYFSSSSCVKMILDDNWHTNLLCYRKDLVNYLI